MVRPKMQRLQPVYERKPTAGYSVRSVRALRGLLPDDTRKETLSGTNNKTRKQRQFT